MSLLEDVKEEIKKKKKGNKKEIPEEVIKMLEEVFSYNDSISNVKERISSNWVSRRLAKDGYTYGRDVLNSIAIQMGRKSWGSP